MLPTPPWRRHTELLVLRMAAAPQWAEAACCSFEAPEARRRILSAAVTAKPSQEKQVGGLIPFENNRKWQPFLGKTKAYCEADRRWRLSAVVLKKRLFLRKNKLQKLPMNLLKISLP